MVSKFSKYHVSMRFSVGICDGVREKGPYLHLVKIELMASPVSRETTEQNAFCPAQKFHK